MAEARSEEEEENMMRDTREQVVRRQPNTSGGRPDRRKPEHRHSQGPLSSIRAAIKRTSNRSTSVSETSRDRERERDRERDRRRPEITILSAEPLASTSWFPGASGGFPPPPPPAAQIWGSTIPPSIQPSEEMAKPPPSYEEVIREKTQEQVLLPSSSSSSSLPSSSSRPGSAITIATQTDPGSVPDSHDSQVKRPVRPPRPRVSFNPKLSHIDDITVTTSQSTLPSINGGSALLNPEVTAPTQRCDLLAELCPPLTSNSAAQTDQTEKSLDSVTASQVLSERPRPRPRTRLSAQPSGNDVKVQTLVKLREDGVATLAARKEADPANQCVSQGRYLQELLEAFSADDWGFPDRRSDSSGNSQSDSEEGDEEDMATLKARIQAFEQQQQQQQQVADGSCEDANNKDFVATKRPEPRPRPRLQQTKSAPPSVAPKPKNFPHAPKPSSKVFLGENASNAESCRADALKTPSVDSDTDPQTASETTPPTSLKSAPALAPQPSKNTEKPSITPKPQPATESLHSGSPVPAPRPPPPRLNPSISETKPPPRPPVAPRASLGAQSPTAGSINPSLPPRPSVEGSGAATTETVKSEETKEAKEAKETTTQTVKAGSGRPGIPTKPAALTSLRRASAPNLAPKPAGASPTPPDPNAVPPKPPAAAPTTAPKPPGTTPAPKPPSPAPAPALRKSPAIQTKPETNAPSSADPALPPRPSSIKLLPLRPPPIKSTPGRPPPPSISSTSPSTQVAPPPSKASPATAVSASSQQPPTQTTPTPLCSSANQKALKKGPPLPPRPKPGHPLYNSYMKQEVLIVLDDPSPAEPPSGEGWSHTSITPLINPSQCLLDLDPEPEVTPDRDVPSKPALEDLGRSDSQSIIPVQPSEQKEQPEPLPVSGPRCVALFDYEGEEEDELTFSQGDVIALSELIGQEWGRGQIHGRVGIFPLNFAEVVEPPPSKQEEKTKQTSADTAETKTTAPASSQDPEVQEPEVKEWAVALFDFPGQTADDLSFQKGALIQVMERIDAEWRRGRLDGKEGLYPAAFTQSCQGQQSVLKGVAKFDFTAESDDELTLKVGDIITQVEPVDQEWILGVAGGKRGIVPKNFISLLC